jgi:tyrosyl-tRNA synthetase
MTDPVADAEPVSVAELAPPQMSISEAAGPAVVGATSGDMEVLALADAVADVGMFNGMSLDARMEQILSVGQECVNEDGLRALLTKKPTPPVAYDGFEPSGRMHIAQGVMKAINVNKLTSAGCTFTFWVADWFAKLNNKMGGDLNKIRVVGEYFIEVWKACGMDMDKVTFLWASEEINARPDEYWSRVMDIASLNSVTRIRRCGPIMGRSDHAELSAAQIMYPCMQCADIFFLKADICQLGMDQKKVNMLAREYCDQAKPKLKNKPVILSHRMMPGLKQGQEKMSKSDPSSAIFMEDSEQDVNVKIKSAFCPEGTVEGNPVLEYLECIVFPSVKKGVEICRSESNGGSVIYTTYEQLAADFAAGALHPGDVKPATARALNIILQPVRDHFKNDIKAKKILSQVKAYMKAQAKAS